MNYPQFWKNATLRRKRIYSIIFVFVLSVLATLIGLLVPVSPQQAQAISDMLNQTVTQGQANGTLIQDIFLNNFPLCLLMFIPLVGFGVGMFILFSTGQAFRAVFEIQAASGAAGASSTAANISPITAILALVLIGIVFLLEYISYSIGMAESIWLFRRILQNRWNAELKYLGIFIGIVALLLIIGAIVETLTLSIGL
jgi:preprotein translocase subunit SecG